MNTMGLFYTFIYSLQQQGEVTLPNQLKFDQYDLLQFSKLDLKVPNLKRCSFTIDV